MAALFAPRYVGGTYLARLTERPFVHPDADICHFDLRLEPQSYIGERVVVHQGAGGGPVTLKARAAIMRDSVIETGQGGSVTIGEDSFIHPRCQIVAYKSPLTIGADTMVAAGCAFYTFNHGIAPDRSIREQPVTSAGGIEIGSGVWLGYGVVVLDGVHIGDGAVVGAGAVVSRSIPPNAIAVGNPARVLRQR